MTTVEALENLRSRMQSQYTMLFLKTWEEDRWETAIAELAQEMDRGLVTWTATSGPQPPLANAEDAFEPLAMLSQISSYPKNHLFFLKDFHPFLRDPLVTRKLRDIAASLAEDGKTLLFVGPVNEVPLELQKEAVPLDLPLPGIEEHRDVLASVLAEVWDGRAQPLTEDEEERLLKGVLGLTTRESRKTLHRALSGRDALNEDVFAALVNEKRVMVQGSDLLDFYDLDEGVKDVGGLDGLKDWIIQRSEAFSSRAREQGIPIPKGVLLLGVQGCGKSLTARATAKLLSFPLVRLDVANLLSGDRGGTEKNLREVLYLIETISPAVLWLDEIEKGFAGSGESGQDATMSRLVGTFLTWMEDRKAPVFVVATANSVTGLPPEMLRRGRFDEMFFIDLPNYHERKHIISIHLGKRGWKAEKFDVAELATRSEGYSGAELEQVVISAMLDAYGQKRLLTDEDLERSRDQTVPLSVTMEEKIFQLREWAATRCRRATSDSRVTQMLEEEKRRGEDIEPVQKAKTAAWSNLAELGQTNAAMVEYLRKFDGATFPQIQEAFAPYLESTGGLGLALRADPNVVLWVGMGQSLTVLLAEMIEGKRIYVHPADIETYKAQNKGLKLPLAGPLTEEREKRPVWLPSCLRLMPPAGGSGKFARVARVKLGGS